MGGVGGSHFISFVRHGFQKFNIADYDRFDLVNFNRQYGANTRTVGRKKTEVMKEHAKAINPECDIKEFNEKVSKKNLEEFLEGASLAIDGIDCWEVDARRDFLNTAYNLNVPVISAGPVGFSTAYIIFMQGKGNMSPDQYFAWRDDQPYDEKLGLFFLGVFPSALQIKYMGIDKERLRKTFVEKSGPSSIGAINLCSGVTVINGVRILLKKEKVKAAPYYHQFDAMADRYKLGRLRWGNSGPVQQLKKWYMLKVVRDCKTEKEA